jgi:hypothetical protein
MIVFLVVISHRSSSLSGHPIKMIGLTLNRFSLQAIPRAKGSFIMVADRTIRSIFLCPTAHFNRRMCVPPWPVSRWRTPARRSSSVYTSTPATSLIPGITQRRLTMLYSSSGHESTVGNLVAPKSRRPVVSAQSGRFVTPSAPTADIRPKHSCCHHLGWF